MDKPDEKIIYILNDGWRPTIGGRYDIGPPPRVVRHYPHAVTLIRNEESGEWVVDNWQHRSPPDDLGGYVQVLLSPATQ